MLQIKKLWQNKILYVFLIIVLVLSVPVMNKSAESEMRTIIVAIGVDKHESGLEISANVLQPKGAGDVRSNLKLASATGNTVNEALYNLGVKMGKKTGLAHCEIIVVSDEILQEDSTKYLDFFIRSNNLTTNSVLVSTNDKAKDVLKVITDSGDPHNFALNNMIEFNDHFLFSIKMNIESFYKAYYSKPSVALLGIFNTSKVTEIGDSKKPESALGEAAGDPNISSPNVGSPNDQTGSSESSGEEGEEQDGAGKDGGEGAKPGGEQSDQNKKVLDYSGKIAVLKNGKKVREMSKEEVNLLKLVHSYSRTAYVEVEDVSMQQFKNATITLEVFDKKIKREIFFNNGIPTFKLSLDLNVKVDEINGEDYNEQSLYEISNFLNDEVKNKLLAKIENEYAILIEKCKEYDTDVFAVYNRFYKFATKEWKDYMLNLENQKDYLNGVVFEFDLTANLKY